jgi:hypothetical protein
MRAHPVEAVSAIATVVAATAAVVGAIIATQALSDSSDAVNVASKSLEATQRAADAQVTGVEAQTQPLISHVPLGRKLPEPFPIDFYPADRQEIYYEGEVLFEQAEQGEPGELFVSIPMRNVGPGVAMVTRAWVFITEPDDTEVKFRDRNLPPYVAPQQEFRLSQFLDVGYVGPELVQFYVVYEDFTGDTEWESRITALRDSERLDAYETIGSRTRRVK